MDGHESLNNYSQDSWVYPYSNREYEGACSWGYCLQKNELNRTLPTSRVEAGQDHPLRFNTQNSNAMLEDRFDQSMH